MNKTIFEMSDDEIVQEIEGLHYDIYCESGGMAASMQSYCDKLEAELERRHNKRVI